MELVDTTPAGFTEHASQELHSPSVVLSMIEALHRGATKLTIFPDGDVKTDLGGWEDDLFTSSTIVGRPARGDEITSALGPVLAYNTRLLELHMVKLGLEAEQARPLAEALPCNTTLRKLHLGNNKLGDQGVAILSQPLASSHSTLQALHLNRCNIGPAGAQALAHTLRHGTLLELHLGNNHIQDQGAVALAGALELSTCTLGVLGLSSNHIADLGAQKLAHAIGGYNRTLHTLQLRSNQIGPLGVESLAAAMEMNTQLQTLTLQDNVQDQERACQSIPCHVSGISLERVWRAPPIASSKAIATVQQQLAINCKPDVVAEKSKEARKRRIALRLGWCTALQLNRRSPYAGRKAAVAGDSEALLWYRIAHLLPDDAFQILILAAVPKPNSPAAGR